MSTTKTFGSGGDYANAAAWKSAWASGGWIGQQKTGESSGGTPHLDFSGLSPGSAADFTTITQYSGSGFGDNPSVQTNNLAFNTANGVYFDISGAYAYFCKPVSYLTLQGLQIRSAGGVGITNNSFVSSVSVLGCILSADGGYRSGSEIFRIQDLLTFTNNLFFAESHSGSGFSQYLLDTHATGSGNIVASNTFVATSGITFSGGIVRRMDTGDFFYNNAVFGFTGSIISAGSGVSASNNATDLSSAPGSSNQVSKTYSSQFVSITSTFDFKLKTGADCIGHGVSNAYTPSNDIAGTSRGASPDIGCWQFVSGGGGSFNPGWTMGATKTIGAVF